MMELAVDGCLLQELDYLFLRSLNFQCLHSHIYRSLYRKPHSFVYITKLSRTKVSINSVFVKLLIISTYYDINYVTEI